MTLRVSAEPFTDLDPSQWDRPLLGPAWVEIQQDGRHVTDVPVATGLDRFIAAALRMTVPGTYSYGTAYAAWLGGDAVSAGTLHYDLGRRDPRGAVRFCGTWSSDGVQIGNAYVVEPAAGVLNVRQPLNRHVVAFNEGTDLHRREPLPARPGQWGIFCSVALYGDGEPANLHCPRLAALRDRGPRAAGASTHAPVARTAY